MGSVVMDTAVVDAMGVILRWFELEENSVVSIDIVLKKRPYVKQRHVYGIPITVRRDKS